MQKRLALVGVGKWGSNFLRTITASGQDELSLIVSTQSRQQLDAIAASNARILPDIKAIDKYAADIDGAIVATPPDVRPAIVEKLLQLGVAVLAEKPLSLDAETSIRLVRLAKNSGVSLLEDYIHLYSWPYLLLTQQLQDSWPISIDSRAGNRGPFRDYSPLMDYAPHDLAMILQIFDRLPEAVDIVIDEYQSNLAFNAAIKLDFAELGHANMTIGNINCEKIRQFTLTQADTSWCYEGSGKGGLTRNGMPQTSALADYSSMQLLLDQFCGRRALYQADKSLWLSEAVAEVLGRLQTRLDSDLG